MHENSDGEQADVADDTNAFLGTDGDLLVVGSLGMGITDETRERLIRHAVEGRTGNFERTALPSSIDIDLRDALGVRQDADGYALTKFDLRMFSAALGSSDGLVVALPAYVDGIPVVRIAAEAFARRLVQGVGVRLLVVPDTVASIATGAFSVLSAQHIHLDRNVCTLGEQPCDVAGVSPRLARREFSVERGNARYEAREGSLFDDEGRRLLFLASPYDAQVDLPAGIERITDAAFALGCEPPSVVRCPSSLTSVDAKAWDDAVWLCPDDAAVRRPLAARGVRLAGTRAVEQEGCWYDFDDEGAVLVAGPPAPASVSRRFAQAAALRAAALQGLEIAAPLAGDENAVPSSELLTLPHEVQGQPLVRIGVRALPYAPATLVVPDTVHTIERDNFCRGVKRLVLPEGLQRIGSHCFCSRTLEAPVSIPASVRSVGDGSFEYAVCRFERTGSIVHVSADQLLTCFCSEPAVDGVPFDFSCYDELLCSGKNLPDKLGAVLHRIAVPYRLSSRVREVLVAYLRSHEGETLQRIARDGDRAMVTALVDAGFIDERTFDRQIELLRACNRTDCVIYLMNQRQKQRSSEGLNAEGASYVRDCFAL
ncbi:MAG: leucine-rich repeat protein [Gordonibacter sp.]|nr:leucine-rich repeat protein [Gordonibacter sp.]